MEKPPAFQFYPKDFLTDVKVMLMSSEARGMYIMLLCMDWLSDGIPENTASWFTLSGNRNPSPDNKLIAELSGCFMAHPSKSGFVTNPRLQKERRKQAERSVERSKAGRKGAKSRWVSDFKKELGQRF
ncbi:YdaU family protein [Candidatus Parcubacteria bacterium]|nr:YdaU family protein [Candidatus Parcubacteria bacterium]